MSGVFTFGRVFGITIRAHFSWLLIFLLVAWSLAGSYLPVKYPGWEVRSYWVVGVIGSALLFACVLVHELSHSLLAVSRGHKVTAITLFILGGVSEIEEEADTASEEFWIAVVGPLASVVLAAIFGVLLLLLGTGRTPLRALAEYLTVINLMLAVFNLVPAYPLDGGRVLKALVWRATGSLSRADAVATTTGTMLGFAVIAIGILIAITTSILSGLWLVFIGWFIQSSASFSRQQTQTRSALAGRLVRDAMQEEFTTVGPNLTVRALLDDHITREFQRAYVVSFGNRFEGLVTVGDVMKVPPDARAQTYVSGIMTRADSVQVARPDEPLADALERLIHGDVNQLVVMEGTAPVGLLGRGDVLRVIEIGSLFPARTSPS